MKSACHLKINNSEYVLPTIKFALQVKIGIMKNCELDISQVLKYFGDKICGDFNVVLKIILKICQNVKDLCKSMNKYFPNDQYTIFKICIGQKSIKHPRHVH